MSSFIRNILSFARFGLHDACYDYSLPFILNLAVADLLYCAVNLPLYAAQYFANDAWGIGGEAFCTFSAAFRCVKTKCTSVKQPAFIFFGSLEIVEAPAGGDDVLATDLALDPS